MRTASTAGLMRSSKCQLAFQTSADGLLLRRQTSEDHSHPIYQSSNISWLTYLSIIIFTQATQARGEADLTLQDNPGLHAFTYYGAFADDISFGKLIVTIDTKRIMKAVQKLSLIHI